MPEIASPPASTLTPAKTARQRTDTFTSIWMIIAVAMALVTLVVKNRMPQPLWTMIHLVTLGVLSNGIFQWSWFFARSLARLSADDPRARRHNTIRILIFNACFLLLFVSMWLGWMVGTMIAATGIAAVAAWHGAEMLSVLRERLASRFVIVVRYYVCSASFFVLAALLASFVSATMFSPSVPEALVAMRDRLTLAHALSGVAGWVGLTIGGTVITLGPTILRTRMSPDAVRGGVRVLLPWCLSLLLAIAGALLGVMPLVGAGILAVGTCAIVGIVYPYAKVLRNKGPREYSAWSFLLGLLWISVGVCALGVASLFVSTPSQLRALTLMWLPIIGIAGFAQLFQGALSYLMPVVIGGGPSVVRIGIAIIDWQYSLRLGLRNSALILELFLFFTSDSPSVHVLRMAGWLLVIATFVIDVVIYAKTGITQAQARRARSETLSESRQVQ
jgi:putative membrane protein